MLLAGEAADRAPLAVLTIQAPEAAKVASAPRGPEWVVLPRSRRAARAAPSPVAAVRQVTTRVVALRGTLVGPPQLAAPLAAAA